MRCTIMQITPFPNIIEALCQRENISTSILTDIASNIFTNQYNEYEITALLIALKTQTLSSEHLFAFTQALQHSNPSPYLNIKVNHLIGDCCGTGGDQAGTFNVSTAVAFVAASQGLSIAKHGNRKSSSQSGAADVLQALNIPITLSHNATLQALRNNHFCFLFAPDYYPSFSNLALMRKSLKVKTIFNLIGPLLNPFKLDFQLLGVYEEKACLPMAETLRLQKINCALVIHGSGLDELALHGPSTGYFLSNNNILPFKISPEAVGLPYYPLEELKGGNPQYNAKAIIDVFSGHGRPAYRDAVLFNAGALFYVANQVDSIKEGVMLARDLIKSKQVLDCLFTIIREQAC
jgi:anthranilate phosphoribosyltransferase